MPDYTEQLLEGLTTPEHIRAGLGVGRKPFEGDTSIDSYAKGAGDLYEEAMKSDAPELADKLPEMRQQFEKQVHERARRHVLETMAAETPVGPGRSYDYAVRRLAGVGQVYGAAKSLANRYGTEPRFAQGQATAEDYQEVARQMAEANESKGVGRKVVDLATELPAVVAEWGANPAGAIGRAAALKTAGYAPQAAGWGAKTVGALGEGLARTSTAGLAGVIRGADEGGAEGAAKAAASEGIANTLFSYGGVFSAESNQGLVRKIADGLGAVWANRAAQAGLQGQVPDWKDFVADAAVIAPLEGVLHFAAQYPHVDRKILAETVVEEIAKEQENAPPKAAAPQTAPPAEAPAGSPVPPRPAPPAEAAAPTLTAGAPPEPPASPADRGGLPRQGGKVAPAESVGRNAAEVQPEARAAVGPSGTPEGTPPGGSAGLEGRTVPGEVAGKQTAAERFKSLRDDLLFKFEPHDLELIDTAIEEGDGERISRLLATQFKSEPLAQKYVDAYNAKLDEQFGVKSKEVMPSEERARSEPVPPANVKPPTPPSPLAPAEIKLSSHQKAVQKASQAAEKNDALAELKSAFQEGYAPPLEKLFDAAGLDERERHVLGRPIEREGEQATFSAMSFDKELLGKSGKPLSRERIRQIQEVALAKLGVTDPKRMQALRERIRDEYKGVLKEAAQGVTAQDLHNVPDSGVADIHQDHMKAEQELNDIAEEFSGKMKKGGMTEDEIADYLRRANEAEEGAYRRTRKSKKKPPGGGEGVAPPEGETLGGTQGMGGMSQQNAAPPPPPAGAKPIGTGTTVKPPTKPQTAGSWFRNAVDFLKSFAQKTFPTTTRLSPKGADKLAAAANAPKAAKADWEYFANELRIAHPVGGTSRLGKALADMTTAEKELYGATFLERRLREYRDKLIEDGKQEEADQIGTLVGGTGSPLKDEGTFEKAYQEMLPFWETYRQTFGAQADKNYASLKGKDPFQDLGTVSQISGLPLHALAVGKEAGGVAGKGLAGVKLKNPGFTRKAELSGETYDVNLEHMMRHTLDVGISAARRAEAARQLEKDGVIHKIGGKPPEDAYVAQANGKYIADEGAHPEPPKGWEYRDLPGNPAGFKELVQADLPEGYQYLALDPARGLAGLDKDASYYVHPDAFLEVAQGLGIESRFGLGKQLAGIISPVTSLLNKVALASPVELASHVGNHLTAQFRPGMGIPGVNIVKEMIPNMLKIAAKDVRILADIKNLTEISASFGHEARPGILGEKYQKWDPTAYLQKFSSGAIDIMQKAVRVQLSHAYDRMVTAGHFPDSPGHKRDFINQALGNYSGQATNRFTQFLKDSGLQPFATAASTFTTQGIKAAFGGAINAPTTSNRAAVQLRATALAKMLPVLAAGPVINYLLWGNAFPKNVPSFAVKTSQDEDGKSHYFDQLYFTGLRRGWRATGMNAVIEGAVHPEERKNTLDTAARGIIGTAEHLVAGPPVQFLHTAVTGENAVGRKVARPVSKATTAEGILHARRLGLAPPGSSEQVENVKAALKGVNPIISGATERTKTPRTVLENVMGGLGPFGTKTRTLPKKRVTGGTR